VFALLATTWADIPNWPQMTSPSGGQPGINFMNLAILIRLSQKVKLFHHYKNNVRYFLKRFNFFGTVGFEKIVDKNDSSSPNNCSGREKREFVNREF